MDDHTPKELDEEAAKLERRANTKTKKKPKPSEPSKEEDALITELDKGPMGA